MCCSSDGRFIISGSWDKSVRVWDVSNGQETRRFEGHTNRVTSASFSADGRFVVSASWDKSVNGLGLSLEGVGKGSNRVRIVDKGQCASEYYSPTSVSTYGYFSDRDAMCGCLLLRLHMRCSSERQHLPYV